MPELQERITTTIERRGRCEMDQPQVDPKGEGEGSTESNYPDAHGYEEMSTGAFAVRMEQGKNKNSASGLARFLCFFCQSHRRWDHRCQSLKSVVSFPPSGQRPFVARNCHKIFLEKIAAPLDTSTHVKCLPHLRAQTLLEQTNSLGVEGRSNSVKPQPE